MADPKSTLRNSLALERSDMGFGASVGLTALLLVWMGIVTAVVTHFTESVWVVVPIELGIFVGTLVSGMLGWTRRKDRQHQAQVAAMLSRAPGAPSLETYFAYLSIERTSSALRVRLQMSGQVTDAQLAALQAALHTAAPGSKVSWADVDVLEVVGPLVSGTDSQTIDGDTITFSSNAGLHALFSKLLEQILPGIQPPLPVARMELGEVTQEELEAEDEDELDGDEDDEVDQA